MKIEIATVPVIVVSISTVSICAIATIVIETSRDTSLLQGYAIGVIAIIAYMAIVASSKK
jgi:hypothetical protein